MKTAVITGAASGIGAGLAREAARRGMRVVLADRDEQALADVAAQIGDGASAIPTDVTSMAQVESLAAYCFDHLGSIDYLFNNAGVLHTGRSWEIPAAQWQQSWAVNVEGIINMLRAFVPRMIAADRPAHVINTSSVGGFLPSPLMAPYTATKFAVTGLTESLAGELKMIGSQISVSLLAPGPVRSQIFREPPSDASQGFHDQMTHMLDAHGMMPDDFAALVFDAVLRGDYWIIPQPEAFDDAFRARNDNIAQRKPPRFFGVEG